MEEQSKADVVFAQAAEMAGIHAGVNGTKALTALQQVEDDLLEGLRNAQLFLDIQEVCHVQTKSPGVKEEIVNTREEFMRVKRNYEFTLTKVQEALKSLRSPQ